MFSSKTHAAHNGLAEAADHGAEKAIAATRRAADTAIDSVVDTAESLRDQAGPVFDRAAALASRGADAVRAGSERLREQALRASDRTTGYVRDEPVKAMLMAAATGAALMALLSLLNRSRH